MDLTTLNRVRLRIDKGWPTDDSSIALIIKDVSAHAEKYLNRIVQTAARTQYFHSDGDTRVLCLDAYGDPASVITAVNHDTDRLFGTGTLIDPTDYSFDYQTGLLYLDLAYAAGKRVFRVTYTAGMALTTDAFALAYPDVAGAVELQVIHDWQHRGHMGLTNVSFEQGSVSIVSGKLLPEVEERLRPHRRISIA